MPFWSDIIVDSDLLLRISVTGAGVRSIEFAPARPATGDRSDAHPLIESMRRELDAYFARELRTFVTPLDLQGTEFQLRVWRELETIPFGQTRSYRQVAESIGASQAVRAVGAANGANPIPIVVPCHRVIGSSGKLVGYGGGIALKKRLLALEGAIPLSML